MRKPNFLLIGAMKSGTTALYFSLKQHPEIFMSETKEPNYFAYLHKKSPEPLEGANTIVNEHNSYYSLFKDVNLEKVVGEASHDYLYVPGTAERINNCLPSVKLVCILRNPVDRAYSHYLFLVRNGIETAEDFSSALQLEEQRISANVGFGHYIHRGMYYSQLKRYYEIFSREQINVQLYDDFSSDSLSVMKSIYDFLEVEADFEPDNSIQRNPSGIPKIKLLHNILVKPNPLKKLIQPLLPRRLYKLASRIRDRNLVKPSIPRDMRKKLINIYRDEIEVLQTLINRDLSAWF